MMLPRVVAIVLAVLATPTVLGAQAGTLRVEGIGEPVEVAPVIRRSHAAFPISALAPLGARVQPVPGGALVFLFGDTLRFDLLSPYFRTGDAVFQLADAVYELAGELHLPGQFFREWIPDRYPDYVAVSGAAIRLTRADAIPPPSTSSAPIVILDPGHGGPDTGVIGPGGIREKDVALAITMRLADELRERGFEVHVTRTTDTLIALADRPRLANEWKAGRPASLFVSLHANAGPPSARGFETFFLSEARTEDEHRVAELENAAVRFEESTNGEAMADLDWILANLRNDFYLRASHDLAQVIQGHLSTVHPGPDRGVKQAGFRVLVGAVMPAVLVELGFMSNEREASMLDSDAFQRSAASRLADAIAQFFASHEHLLTAEVGS